MLDDDGLHTVMCEVEAILNDRPITELSDDPNDLEPLPSSTVLQSVECKFTMLIVCGGINGLSVQL